MLGSSCVCVCVYQNTRGIFLRYFLNILKEKGVSKQKEGNLKNEIRKSNEKRTKRALGKCPLLLWTLETFLLKNIVVTFDLVSGTDCTVGNITQVTISDQIFPFDYDTNQFNSCLSASVVKDNLNAITEKVVQKDYLKIVLSKLQEVGDRGH